MLHNRLATYLSADSSRKYTGPILTGATVPPVITRGGVTFRLVLVITVPVAVPVPSPIS
jgi:hypothetical protein